MAFLIFAFLILVARAHAGSLLIEKQDVGNFQQCGGINWTGETNCGPGFYCYQQNQWYWQCQPGVGPIAPSGSPTGIAQPTKATQLSVLTSCLGTSLTSQLYSPLNPGSGYASYDWLRTSHLNRIDKRPAAVLMIQNISTVSLAVKCAQLSGIQPVVRSGGHSYEGLSTLDGKLVIDVSYCNRITKIFEDPVGSGKYKATLESGIRLGKFYTDLWDRGQWSFTAGECPWVGAGGHFLGGGQGMQTRFYGLAIDQITAIDIVLASGTSVTATGSNSYSDLFWALRGVGSSSFGVVTRFTVNIFKAPQNAVFFLYFQLSIRFLQLWQTYFVNFPDELGAYVHLQNNEFYIKGHYLGTLDNLRAILAPILSDSSLISSQMKSCSVIEARSFIHYGANMAATTPINTNGKGPQKSKCDFIAQLLPDSVLQAIVDTTKGAQNLYIGGHLLGGNGVHSAVAADATAYPARNAWYSLEYGTWGNAAMGYAPGSAEYNRLQSMQSALAPYSSGKYYNWIDIDFPLSDYFGVNLARLMDVKAKYDPGNFFNGPLMIPLPPTLGSPTLTPTAPPTKKPNSAKPNSLTPSLVTSVTPTLKPTFNPTSPPSRKPTCKFSSSAIPTRKSTFYPSCNPTEKPISAKPTTAKPTYLPTAKPTNLPTAKPTKLSTSCLPSKKPSKKPTRRPSKKPSLNPSSISN